MEEQGSNLSIDIPPPELLQGAAKGIAERELDLASTTPPPSPPPTQEERLTSRELPIPPAIRMNEEEMQEHRDAILQQQMLGQQLLRELCHQHERLHHN